MELWTDFICLQDGGCPTFKETISAAEAYTYFFANGYENDRVVKSVVKELGLLPEPDAPAEP